MIGEPLSIFHGDYVITTDRSQLTVAEVHKYLSGESYWSKGIPLETVQRSFDHSFVIGVLHRHVQVGFVRLVTDYATFGYLADVYVLEEHRGKGLSKAMMDLLMSLPWVKGLRRLMLATADAHGLYARYGFAQPARPERLMEIVQPSLYGGIIFDQNPPPTIPPTNES